METSPLFGQNQGAVPEQTKPWASGSTGARIGKPPWRLDASTHATCGPGPSPPPPQRTTGSYATGPPQGRSHSVPSSSPVARAAAPCPRKSN